MAATKTLIVSDDEVKKAFKIECTKNGTDMSTVTEMLWLKYVGLSINKRKERAEIREKQKEERERRKE